MKTISAMAKRFAVYFLSVFFVLSLAACGGGGDSGAGGGGGAGSPPAGSGLEVNPKNIRLEARQNGALPTNQTFAVTITSNEVAKLIVGIPAGATLPPWTTFSLNETSAGFTVSIGANSTALAPGDYPLTIRVVGVRADESVVAYRDVGLVYYIAALSTGLAKIDVTYVKGASLPPPNNLPIRAPGLNWTATASQPWITLSPSSGSGNVDALVSLDPTGLQPGSYSGQITVKGSDGDSATVDVTLTVVALTLQPSVSTLNFSGINGSSIAAQSVKALLNTSQGFNWTASSDASWLVLNRKTGTQTDAIDVSVNPTIGPLASGNYTAQILLSAGLGAETATTSVIVNLVLTKPTLAASAPNLNFSGINGATLVGQSLKVTLNNGQAFNWTASSNAAWLGLNRLSGTQADGFDIAANPAIGPLASGNYSAQIQLSTSVNGEAITASVPITLILTKPTLSVSVPNIILGGANGRDLSGKDFKISLNTGNNAFPWTLFQDNAWVVLNATSGTISDNGVTLGVAPDYAQKLQSAGPVNLTNLIFSATVNGDYVSTGMSVGLQLDTHRILASEAGVAFAKTPAWSRLSRTLKTKDNFGVASAWKAISSKPWLTVTANGLAGGELVLTANDSGLALDTLHEATVTLTSDDPTIRTVEKVQVGLWVGSTTPTATVSIPGTFSKVKMDPVRPYAYVHDGGTELRTYNIYTGLEILPRIVNVAPTMGAMAIANDGSMLYVIDTANNKMVPVDLAARAAKASWTSLLAAGSAKAPNYVTYTRSNGVGVLLPNSGTAYLAETGAALGANSSPSGYFAATGDGTKVFAHGSRYDIDYTSLNNGRFSMKFLGSIPLTSPSHADTATNWDGSQVFAASGGSVSGGVYGFEKGNGLTLLADANLPGNAYPNNVELGSDGRVFCGSSNWYDPVDVWVYNSSGSLLKSFKAGGYAREMLDRQLGVSGDALMMVIATSIPDLKFIPVGP